MGGSRPVRIMGVINASPESFYKGSVAAGYGDAARAAARMEAEGADIIDVGGMSTAPYLRAAVPEEAEARRVARAVEAAVGAAGLPVSVDTCRAAAAEAGMRSGASILNDVTGLKHDPGMAAVLSRHSPSVVLCAHRRRARDGGPGETASALRESAELAARAGVPPGRAVADPAVGFFRRGGRGRLFSRIASSGAARRDAEVLDRLREVGEGAGLPLLASVSRKSFLGALFGQEDPASRLPGSLAFEALAVMRGADAVRTHDVAATAAAVDAAAAGIGRRARRRRARIGGAADKSL